MVSLTRLSPRRVALAGTAASVAYLGEMAIDMRLTGNRYDDIVLWGHLLSRNPRYQRALGLLVHFSLGLSLAAVYQVVRPALPRLSPPLLGALFAQVESAVTFPSVLWADRHHPAMRSGALPPLWSNGYFLAEAARHAAYGAVLGLLSEDTE